MSESRTQDSESPVYTPPQVENVLDLEEIARENFYAGSVCSGRECDTA